MGANAGGSGRIRPLTGLPRKSEHELASDSEHPESKEVSADTQESSAKSLMTNPRETVQAKLRIEMELGVIIENLEDPNGPNLGTGSEEEVA